MNDSILSTIKKMLGIEESYTQFDSEIVVDINSVFLSLAQLGVGPSNFSIADKTATWTDLFGTAEPIEAVKSYIYLKVRLVFDPPTSAFVLDAVERQIKEMEWRINLQAETPASEEVS